MGNAEGWRGISQKLPQVQVQPSSLISSPLQRHGRHRKRDLKPCGVWLYKCSRSGFVFSFPPLWLFSCPVVSDSLWPRGLQHARLPSLLGLAQTHVHCVSDAIQPSHPLSSPSPPTPLFSSVQFCCSVVSDSLQPHELQHARPPCPSPTPGVHSDSHPLSQWCHSAISFSVVPFFSCPQSLPASKSFIVSNVHQKTRFWFF